MNANEKNVIDYDNLENKPKETRTGLPILYTFILKTSYLIMPNDDTCNRCPLFNRDVIFEEWKNDLSEIESILGKLFYSLSTVKEAFLFRKDSLVKKMRNIYERVSKFRTSNKKVTERIKNKLFISSSP